MANSVIGMARRQIRRILLSEINAAPLQRSAMFFDNNKTAGLKSFKIQVRGFIYRNGLFFYYHRLTRADAVLSVRMYGSYKIRRFSATGTAIVKCTTAKMYRYRTVTNRRGAVKSGKCLSSTRGSRSFYLCRCKSAVKGLSADYYAFYGIVGIEGYYIGLFADLY